MTQLIHLVHSYQWLGLQSAQVRFKWGEKPPNIAYLINVNYSFTHWICKVCKFSSAVKSYLHAISFCSRQGLLHPVLHFQRGNANDSLSNCLNEPERCSFLFMFSYLQSSEIEIICRYYRVKKGTGSLINVVFQAW